MKPSVIVFLLLLAPAALPAFCQLPNVRPFSADMVTTHAGQTMQGKIYLSGDKMRLDMNSHGHQGIMIADFPKKTSYMLMPEQKMYMEYNAAMAERGGMRLKDFKPVDPNNPCGIDATMKCRKVGTDTVNGRSCDKWEISTEGGSNQTTWVDQKLHFMIKNVGSDGTSTELKNIQEGPQPSSLFEIPAGYRKFDMGGMMGQRPPGN